MTSVSSLRALSDIIADSVTQIEQCYAKASATVPLLDEPFNPANQAEAVAMDPAVGAASALIIAAASQLTATVRHPALSLMNGALSVMFPSHPSTIFTKTHGLCSIIFRRAYVWPLP